MKKSGFDNVIKMGMYPQLRIHPDFNISYGMFYSRQEKGEAEENDLRLIII